MCLGIVINVKPFGRSYISSLDKCHLDKLTMLELTNLLSYQPSNNVELLHGSSNEG